jgi:hypothetical protein
MITVIEGMGRDTDRTSVLGDAIMDAINVNAQGMSLAAIVGTLELVKMEVLFDAEPADD